MSEIIPPQSKPSNKRVILKRALIDVDLLHSPEIIGIRRKFGPAGALAMIEIICQLSKSHSGIIDKEIALEAIDFCKLEDPEGFLSYCVQKQILMLEGDNVTKDSVIEDRQKLSDKQEGYRERKRLERERKANKHNNLENVTQMSRVTSSVTSSVTPEHIEHIEHTEHTEKDLNPNPKEGGQGETKPTQSSIVQNKPPKIQFGEHVFLTQTEIDNVQNKHGTAFFERCCEKLNAWIEQDPTPKRRKNGKNAGATFRAWVLNAVAEEEVRASRTTMRAPPRLSNAEKTMAVYRKIEAEELAKMGMKDEEN